MDWVVAASGKINLLEIPLECERTFDDLFKRILAWETSIKFVDDGFNEEDYLEIVVDEDGLVSVIDIHRQDNICGNLNNNNKWISDEDHWTELKRNLEKCISNIRASMYWDSGVKDNITHICNSWNVTDIRTVSN
jgi:hypothetical protein